MSSPPSDRGQATPLWAVVLVCAGLLLIPTARLVRATVERAQAQTAADAAALAGALRDDGTGGRAARAVAEANDAVLVSYTEASAVVEVTVRVGGHTARARAERTWTRTPAPRPSG